MAGLFLCRYKIVGVYPKFECAWVGANRSRFS